MCWTVQAEVKPACPSKQSLLHTRACWHAMAALAAQPLACAGPACSAKHRSCLKTFQEG